MTDKDLEKRRDRERRIILAHSIAKQAVTIENTTYSEAIQILEDAKTIITRNMERQRASVPSEIRDRWGAIIEMSETEVSDNT